MQNAPGRSWSELEGQTTFRLEVDGFHFLLAEPSVTQMLARGYVPQALVFGQQQQRNGSGPPEAKFLVDEKTQDHLILSHVIEPVLWDGSGEQPEGSVPLARLGRFRDRIINAIFDRIFNAEIVRGAAFRGGEGSGPESDPGSEGVGPDAGGAASAA